MIINKILLFMVAVLFSCACSPDGSNTKNDSTPSKLSDDTIVVEGKWGEAVNGLRMRIDAIHSYSEDGYFYIDFNANLENTQEGITTVFLKPPEGLASDYPIGASIKIDDRWIPCSRVNGADLPFSLDIQGGEMACINFISGWKLGVSPEQYEIKTSILVHEDTRNISWNGRMESGVASISLN